MSSQRLCKRLRGNSDDRDCGHCQYQASLRADTASAAADDGSSALQLQATVPGTRIRVNEVSMNAFDKGARALPSLYNGPTIKGLFTEERSSTGVTKLHMIANMIIGGKRIQFIAIDGNSLLPFPMTGGTANRARVVEAVNSGSTKPITLEAGQANDDLQKSFVDGFCSAQWYAMFLFDVFNRIGVWDTTDWVFLSVLNTNMPNAYWNGTYMTYGNQRRIAGAMQAGVYWTAMDIVGHEAGHGIVQALGGLLYQGESGALNESIADILGTTFEQYYCRRNGRMEAFDYTIGEDMRGAPVRSMSDPNKTNSPGFYQGNMWRDPTDLFTDNGGVHYNSGVLNRWFYVVSTGQNGVNERDEPFAVDTPWLIQDLCRLVYYAKDALRDSQMRYLDFAMQLRSTAHSRNAAPQLITSIEQGFLAVGLTSAAGVNFDVAPAGAPKRRAPGAPPVDATSTPLSSGAWLHHPCDDLFTAIIAAALVGGVVGALRFIR